jgi:hypothetical protein
MNQLAYKKKVEGCYRDLDRLQSPEYKVRQDAIVEDFLRVSPRVTKAGPNSLKKRQLELMELEI